MSDSDTISRSTASWPLWRYLLLLLLLTAGIRIWQICHTEVVSRDSLTYIRIAWQMEHGELRQVLRSSMHHPGYPFSILLVSRVVRPFFGDDLVTGMQVSAQIATALASLLLVIPLFLLGLELFNPRISFWATVLFQCLPASSKLFGDGLSEGLFLLLASSGLLTASWALRLGNVRYYVLAGMFSGLAYLVRPEGLAICGATAVILYARQMIRYTQIPFPQFALRGTSLVAATLSLAVPFMMTIGHLSTKMSVTTTMEGAQAPVPVELETPPVAQVQLLSHPLAIWSLDKNSPSDRFVWACKAFVQVLSRALFWYLWPFTFVGMWIHRRSLLQQPLTWLYFLTSCAVLAALYRVALRLGYVSERHLLLVVLAVLGPTAAGVTIVADWVARKWFLPTSSARVSLALFAILLAIPTYKSLETLHLTRSGFRQVGYWLAAHTDTLETLEDPFGWSYYYSGRIFSEPIVGRDSSARKAPRFVVLEEETGNKHPHLLGWAPAEDLTKQASARVVLRQPLRKGEIRVYDLHPTGQ